MKRMSGYITIYGCKQYVFKELILLWQTNAGFSEMYCNAVNRMWQFSLKEPLKIKDEDIFGLLYLFHLLSEVRPHVTTFLVVIPFRNSYGT